METVKVLIEGYAKEEKGKEVASSSVTLIQNDELNILVDTGSNRSLLLRKLEEENIKCEDIDFVVITHTHLDHCLLMGMFENARILDSDSVYTFSGIIYEHDGIISGTNVKMIATPGHDQFHCSVLVETKKYGLVAIVADVFWWEDGNQPEKINEKYLLELVDPYVKNETELKESRKNVLKLADYIIPGHGKMFKVRN